MITHTMTSVCNVAAISVGVRPRAARALLFMRRVEEYQPPTEMVQQLKSFYFTFASLQIRRLKQICKICIRLKVVVSRNCVLTENEEITKKKKNVSRVLHENPSTVNVVNVCESLDTRV